MPTRKPVLAPPASLAAEVQHLASRQSDTSSVLQAVQVDVSHLVNAVNKLTAISERQAELAAKQANHSEAIDRAFGTMKEVKAELTRLIDGILHTVAEDRRESQKTAETVVGYRANLRLMNIVGGIVGFLLVTLVGLGYTQLTAAIERNTSKIEVLEAKTERQRIEDTLVVAEHERRLSRLEERGDEISP